MLPTVMKIYGWSWHVRHGLSAGQAAALLQRQGVTGVVLQNTIAPVPTTSSIDQLESGATLAFDLDIRHAMHDHGIKTYEIVPMFFEPSLVFADPSAHPIGDDGLPVAQRDWYIGMCPTYPGRVADRAAKAAEIVDVLTPDGVFLDFVRWPGFWETWIDGQRGSDRPTCMCDRCLGLFAEFTGTSTPPRAKLHGTRDWTEWKCTVITDAVRSMRAAVGQTILVVNVVPFTGADFDGAVEHTWGQRVSDLGQIADVVSPMPYHQILKRDPEELVAGCTSWIRAETDADVWPCVQVAASYLDDSFADEGRATSVTEYELSMAVRAAESAGASAVASFHWADYLDDSAHGGHKLDVIEAISGRGGNR